MSISLQCPHCQKKLKTRDELAGKRVKCPGCGQNIPVPLENPPEQTKATPPPLRGPSSLISMGVLVSFAMVVIAHYVSWGAVSTSSNWRTGSGMLLYTTVTDSLSAHSFGWYGNAMLGLGGIGLAAGLALLIMALARISSGVGFFKFIAGAAGWGGLVALIATGVSNPWMWKNLDISQAWPLGQALTGGGFVLGGIFSTMSGHRQRSGSDPVQQKASAARWLLRWGLTAIAAVVLGAVASGIVGNGLQRQTSVETFYLPTGEVKNNKGMGSMSIYGIQLLKSDDVASFRTESDRLAMWIGGGSFALGALCGGSIAFYALGGLTRPGRRAR